MLCAECCVPLPLHQPLLSTTHGHATMPDTNPRLSILPPVLLFEWGKGECRKAQRTQHRDGYDHQCTSMKSLPGRLLHLQCTSSSQCFITLCVPHTKNEGCHYMVQPHYTCSLSPLTVTSSAVSGARGNGVALLTSSSSQSSSESRETNARLVVCRLETLEGMNTLEPKC